MFIVTVNEIKNKKMNQLILLCQKRLQKLIFKINLSKRLIYTPVMF